MAKLIRKKVRWRAVSNIYQPIAEGNSDSRTGQESFLENAEIKITDSLMPKFDAESAVLLTHNPLIGNLISDSIGQEFKIEILNGSTMRIDFKGKQSHGKGKIIRYI